MAKSQPLSQLGRRHRDVFYPKPHGPERWGLVLPGYLFEGTSHVKRFMAFWRILRMFERAFIHFLWGRSDFNDYLLYFCRKFSLWEMFYIYCHCLSCYYHARVIMMRSVFFHKRRLLWKHLMTRQPCISTPSWCRRSSWRRRNIWNILWRKYKPSTRITTT